ncbi:MAG TPA: hypothetical protein VJO34_11415 [Methylomirabilota bacterium]|nr:hypothetical protein [Methylomirabilota bacterium]
MEGFPLPIVLLLLLMAGFGLLLLSPRLRNVPADYPLWGAKAGLTPRSYRQRVIHKGFPILTLPGCPLAPGEVALLAGRVRLELPPGRSLGRAHQRRRKEIPCFGLTPVEWGRLIVTSQRLLFVGSRDSLSLPFASGLGSTGFTRGLLIELAQSRAAYFFRFPHALLFGEAIRLLHAFRWERTARETLERVSEPFHKRSVFRTKDEGSRLPDPVGNQRRDLREAFEAPLFLGAGRRSSSVTWKPF